MAAAEFELNGQSIRVDDVDPQCTLLDWLRASGRTGSKEGCAEGECGACAVAFLSRDAQGRPSFIAVNSCLVTLPDVHGRSIVSVEGVSEPFSARAALGGGALHPVQQALVDQGGSQCGYCTPGFVVSSFCEYYRPGRCGAEAAGRGQLRQPEAAPFDPEAISGNLCRCTGYRPILAALDSLRAPEPGDPWLERLELGPAPLPAIHAASQHPAGQHAAWLHHGSPEHALRQPGAARASPPLFLRPLTGSDLASMLREHAGAMLIGGGTDLMVYSNQRRTRYPALVSVGALAELRRFEVRESEVVIGAALSLSELEQQLAASPAGAELDALRQLLPLFSSRLIRNRATLGGNLATASPIGDAAPVLLALGACLTLSRGVASKDAGADETAQRQLPLAEFFLGYRKTALAAGEWIESIHVPRPAPRLQRFYKVSKRVLDDISTVAAAFALDVRADGSVASFRAAYGGVAQTPLLATSLAQLARDRPWDPSTLQLLCAAARGIGTPLSDQRGSAAYRSAMIVRLLERFYFETTSFEATSLQAGALPAAAFDPGGGATP
jgi:xanthine dehydrogenase small subunit